MRKLATVRRIDAISPILDADAIECAVIGGWRVVTKKGEYTPGDLAVYCEIDSWIPHEIAPFLSKGKEPREYEGVKGEKLRTVRLRGQLSQGLLLPYSVAGSICGEGDDVTELLGIKKWEPVIPAQLAGQIKGNFPSLIPKTEQERVQNLQEELRAYQGHVFEVTEKLEGSSMTCYLIDGEFGVCSRNYDLYPDENNTFWKVAIDASIESALRMRGFDNLALQGELIGPGIQGNIYKLTKHRFHVFDIYDIAAGRYLIPESRKNLVEKLGLSHAPVLAYTTLPENIDWVLAYAEGAAMFNPNQEREGLVFKHKALPFSFKAISNKYLLKS